MMSESIKGNTETQESSALLKTKRDEFLVDIRKKKNQSLINQKRFKISQGEDISDLSQFIVNNTFQGNNLYEQFILQIQDAPSIELRLKIVHSMFIEGFEKEDWENLVLIIGYLREAIRPNSGYLTGRHLIDLGIVPSLLYLLTDNFSKICRLQSETAWLIANISAGELQDNVFLVQQNCIPILSSCLRTNNEALHENVMWTLSNIAFETEINFKDLILDSGALKEVVRKIYGTQKSKKYYRIAMWLIYNLLKKPLPDFDNVSCCMGVFSQAIVMTDEETQKYTLLSLVGFSGLDDYARFDVISSCQLIPKIVNFLSHENSDLILSALKICGNLSQGHSKITTQLCESGILQVIPGLLSNQDVLIRKEAFFTLSNILADKLGNHDSMFENKILPILLDRLENDCYEVKYEATMSIYNFVLNCTDSEAQLLISKNILEILLANLIENVPNLLITTIKTIKSILRFGEEIKNENGINPYAYRMLLGNGPRIIENLQYHKDNEIYQCVSDLMDSYFPTE